MMFHTLLNHLELHVSSTINQNENCIGSFSRTRHSKWSSQALRALLVVHFFQVHPAHPHYLTDQVNLFSGQVLVSQVLFEKIRERRTEGKRKQEKKYGRK